MPRRMIQGLLADILGRRENQVIQRFRLTLRLWFWYKEDDVRSADMRPGRQDFPCLSDSLRMESSTKHEDLSSV